ncbi:MAG: tyrosine-type recombinase/integrase, partial [Dichotomicrobium sp.]
WMQLMRATGIRVGALSRLTVGDARQALAEGRLTIRGAINKRGKTHVVSLRSMGTRALTELLRIRARLGHPNDPAAPLIMSRQGGKGMSVRTYQQRLRQWVLAAGLGVQVTPHWFRHTLAKRMLDNSTSPAKALGIVQRVLGHSDINTTTVYTRPSREDIDRALVEAGV